MKNIIITGASGVIGSLILQSCFSDPNVGNVTSILRKPTGFANSKLTELIISDFSDYSGISDSFTNQDIAYYCLGVYTGAVSRDEFRKITVDYTKAFAYTLKQFSAGVTFCFLSGQGADQTAKSRMMFARDKGIAENYLLSLKFKEIYIFRPAYIYPSSPRVEPNMSYRIMRTLYPVLKLIYPNGVVTSEDLARTLYKCGQHGGQKEVMEDRDIREYNVNSIK